MRRSKNLYISIIFILSVLVGFAQQRSVRTINAKTPGTNLSDSQPSNEISSSTERFDEWGNLSSQILKDASPMGRSLIQQYEYDEYDRLVKDYLPFSAPSSRWDESLWISSRKQFYEQSQWTAIEQENVVDEYYSGLTYEHGLNRIPETISVPGGDFSNVELTQMSYLNQSPVYKFTLSGSSTISLGSYSAETIVVRESTDEDGKLNQTYTNSLGRTVMVSQKGLETYYVYDILGNVRYVIPPEAIRQIIEEFDEDWSLLNDETFRNHWLFQYIYDDIMRLTESKTPGKDWEYVIYDTRNRPILYQDGNMRENSLAEVTEDISIDRYEGQNYKLTGSQASVSLTAGFTFEATLTTSFQVSEQLDRGSSKWAATKYDKKNRVILTGKYETLDPKSVLIQKAKHINSQEIKTNECEYTDISNTFNFPEFSLSTRNDFSVSFESLGNGTAEEFDYEIYLIINGQDHLIHTENIQTSQYDWVGYQQIISIPIQFQSEIILNCAISFLPNSNLKIRYLTIDDDGAQTTPFVPENVHGYTNIVFPRFQNRADVRTAQYFGYKNLETSSCDVFDTSKYGFVSLEADGYASQYDLSLRDVLTGAKVKIEDTSEYIYSSLFYDDKYRMIQSVNNDILNGTTRNYIAYNWVGTVSQSRLDHIGAESLSVAYNYSYDDQLRLQSTSQEVLSSGLDPIVISKVEYDELGQVRKELIHGNESIGYAQQKDLAYNIRGWLKRINDVGNLGNDVFAFNLKYNDDTNGVSGRANGTITAMEWAGKGIDGLNYNQRRYNYFYDDHDRLINSSYMYLSAGNWQSYTDMRNTERNITYDDNGNILTLSRNNTSGTYVDDLNFEYHGNRLVNVVDDETPDSFGYSHISASGDESYTYDLNGNIKKNESLGILSCVYNDFNLPETVMFENGSYVKYSYDGFGRVLKKQTNNGEGVVKDIYYVGAFQYSRMNNDPPSLDFYSFGTGGRLTKDGNSLIHEYDFKDHLGNLRSVFKPTDGSYQYAETSDIVLGSGTGVYSRTFPWQTSDGDISVSFENYNEYYEIWINMEMLDASGSVVQTLSHYVETYGDWELVNLTFSPNATNAVSGRLVIDHGTSSGLLTLRDMTIMHAGSGFGLDVVQIADYMPFGYMINHSALTSNKYMYNGKEYQEETGAYAYEFRHYDPTIGRFNSMDPMAAIFSNQSPYLYAYNSPITYIDYLGLSGYDPNCVGGNCENECANCENGIWDQANSNDPFFFNEDLGEWINAYEVLSYEGAHQNADYRAIAQSVVDNFEAQANGGGEVDLNTELGLLGVGTATLDQGRWVGQTSKGEFRVYNRAKFHGNQYTTNTNLFKKAGVVGLFIQVGTDGFNLANDPSYTQTFLQNTGLGITSLVIPEVGAGVLIYDLHTTIIKPAYDAFWKQPAVLQWFDRLQNDFNRWIYEHTNN